MEEKQNTELFVQLYAHNVALRLEYIILHLTTIIRGEKINNNKTNMSLWYLKNLMHFICRAFRSAGGKRSWLLVAAFWIMF